jgi:pimeloyl-ACP methyl ester carboxylesterase
MAISPSRRSQSKHPHNRPPQARPQQARPQQPEPPEEVEPRWLLKALGLTVLAAVFCAYVAVCALIHHGAWQLFLHPGKTISQTPSEAGLPFQPIHFDSSATGAPRLTGWWMPRSLDPTSVPTLLLLHDGSGTLSDTLPRLAELHAAGVNLFAFDYRGFGASDGPHPTEAMMNEDADAALDYLTGTRHIPASSIVPVGVGLGASLAAELAARHPELPGVILDDPDPGASMRPILASRAHLLPMHLLIGDHFDVSQHLASVRQPKLLITDVFPAAGEASSNGSARLFQNAPQPKMTVTLPAGAPQRFYVDAIRRFLDEYVTAPHS